MVKGSSLFFDRKELGVDGLESARDEALDGDRAMVIRLGDVKAIADGDDCSSEPERDGGPLEVVDVTEKAEVRHVEGERAAGKSHGDDDAVDGAADETVEEIDPLELCRLPARPRE